MAPAQKLSIESSGTASSEIDISLVSGTSNKECILNFGKNLATADRYLGRIFYQVDNNAMGFWTNGGPKMLINHTGAVGIGTAVPASKLHVYNGDIRIEGGTSGNSNKIYFKTTDNADLNKYIGTSAYWTEIGVHANEGLRVKNSSGTNIFQVSGAAAACINTTAALNGSFLTVGGSSITIGTTSHSDIYMSDTDEGHRRIHCNSNYVGFLNSSNGWGAGCQDNGTWHCFNTLTVAGGASITGATNMTGRGTAWGSQNVGTMLTATGSLGGIEFYSSASTNAAFLCFHKPGAFASYFGLDTDNYFAVGGWSYGAALGNFKCAHLAKSSSSFQIDHPLPALNETHNLFHSVVEAPQADNLYRGKATLVDGTLAVNIDEIAGMTEGTFVLLNREVQCFTSNESDWDAVRGYVNGNILTIECQNQNSTAIISWLVIGERKDKHMYDTDWTDENGKVIVEPLKTASAVENDPSLAD